jgi:2,3-bisphosphoglycerate-independent phosphoglycerate mutase
VALLKLCKQQGFSRVVIHAITDGRDTPPKSAMEHMQLLQKGIDETGVGRVATVIGRYFAMDRDNRWDRTELAYKAIMDGAGTKVASWKQAIEQAYAAGENDEFIKPRLIDYTGAGNDDVMVFFNYRFDRTRQLTKAIVEPDFNSFPVRRNDIFFVAFTHYYDNGHFEEAYPEMVNKNILSEVLAGNGLKQLRCAETEKFAHVTFFFNALRNDPFPGEDRILVDSPKVATYDLKPEMSALEVRDKLVEAINSDKYDVVITNFANGDMVGHTGVFEAIVKAVETIDRCVHDVVEAALAKGGACILTADHGNAEQTKLADGSPMTAHTTNPVQCTVVGMGNIKLANDGRLCDLAPTMLDIMGVAQPAEMDGRSLIIH